MENQREERRKKTEPIKRSNWHIKSIIKNMVLWIISTIFYWAVIKKVFQNDCIIKEKNKKIYRVKNRQYSMHNFEYRWQRWDVQRYATHRVSFRFYILIVGTAEQYFLLVPQTLNRISRWWINIFLFTILCLIQWKCIQ